MSKIQGYISVAKNIDYIAEKRSNRWILTSIAINSPDDVSFDQNGAIKSRLSDH